MTFEARGEARCAPALAPAGPSATLPATVIAQLLQLLTANDGYRARFEANPREALREIGYDTPALCQGIRELDPVMAFDYLHNGLASKEKIVAGRDAWLARLRNEEQIFGPFSICA
jgi:putative modified peptide